MREEDRESGRGRRVSIVSFRTSSLCTSVFSYQDNEWWPLRRTMGLIRGLVISLYRQKRGHSSSLFPAPLTRVVRFPLVLPAKPGHSDHHNAAPTFIHYTFKIFKTVDLFSFFFHPSNKPLKVVLDAGKILLINTQQPIK